MEMRQQYGLKGKYVEETDVSRRRNGNEKREK